MEQLQREQCDGNKFAVTTRSTRAEGAPPVQLQREQLQRER